jgi:hypothetical protein
VTEAPRREDDWRTLRGRIREVLSRFGRHERSGGEFYLVDEDAGRHDLKVQLFTDALTIGLIEAIQAVLSEHDGWTVSFVETDQDGTDMSPLAGVQVTRWGIFPIPPIVWTEEESSEVETLYKALEKLLGARGVSNPFGEGDYWVVDDGWVKHSHKVCIFRIDFLSPALAAEVQQLLRTDFPACVIWFQIEVVEPGAEVPLAGLRVYADRIEQDWDRDLLRSIFKDRFLW